MRLIVIIVAFFHFELERLVGVYGPQFAVVVESISEIFEAFNLFTNGFFRKAVAHFYISGAQNEKLFESQRAKIK